MEQLRRTQTTFVHCLLPQHTAGLCDVRTQQQQEVGSSSGNGGISINVPLLRSQLRGVQALDSVRLHKVGFPESLGYASFWRRFSLLGGGEGAGGPGLGEEKEAVQKLMAGLDMDKSSYRLGNTQIFVRGGVLAHLEEERNDR